jgi:Ca-activated chloride channel homolog
VDKKTQVTKGKTMYLLERARLQTPDGQPIPLLSAHLSGDLRGLLFEACVEQRFVNPADTHAEVVYTFPLPWKAVLLGVDVVLGGQRLAGIVVERAQAQEGYEEALADGNAAILLERNPDHSYTLNLGNLAGREACIITLRYAQVLRFEQHSLRLIIPTVLAPCYGDARPHGLPLWYPAFRHSLVAEHPFSLTLQLHGALAQARVFSPSHPVRIEPVESDQGPVLVVSLARQASLDRDCVLVMDAVRQPGLVVAAPDGVAPDRVAALLSFCPRLPEPAAAPLALKMLVDCSGSMAGDSLAAVQQALQWVVRQLAVGDRFSLSRFGGQVEHRSRHLWTVSDRTRSAARRWIAALNADLGGTELEAALASTFSLAPSVRSDVLVLTDGNISAIDSTVALATGSGQRVFVVGMGSSPSEGHLRRLAEATGGACEWVAAGEPAEPAVLRMVARLRSQPATDLRLQWPVGAEPEWVSALPTSVFDGDAVQVFALLKRWPEGEVHLQGRCGGAIEPMGCARLGGPLYAGNALPRMVAFHHVQPPQGSGARAWCEERAVQLALAYQLVTEQTHCLLVHQRPDDSAATDMPWLQPLAPMLPAGWGGTGSVVFARPRRATRALLTADPHAYDLRFLPKASGRPGLPLAVPWIEPTHRVGLTPWEMAQWLKRTPRQSWPTDYAGLTQMGLEPAVVNWLAGVVASHGGAAHPERRVVQAFVHMMSSRDTLVALAWSAGWPHYIRATVWCLGVLWADNGVQVGDGCVDGALVGALQTLLLGITGQAWPRQVCSLRSETGLLQD